MAKSVATKSDKTRDSKKLKAKLSTSNRKDKKEVGSQKIDELFKKMKNDNKVLKNSTKSPKKKEAKTKEKSKSPSKSQGKKHPTPKKSETSRKSGGIKTRGRPPKSPKKSPKIKSQTSSNLLSQFLKSSGTKPKPQAKASAKMKDVVSEEEDACVFNNNNNNNNNEKSHNLHLDKHMNSLYYSGPKSEADSDIDIDVESLEDLDGENGFLDEEEQEIGTSMDDFGNSNDSADISPRRELPPYPTKDKRKPTQFKCKVCDEWFPNRYFQRKHMLREHEDQLYECRVCSFNSVEPEKLKNHIIKLHVSIKKEKSEPYSATELQEELENLIEKKIPRKVIMEDGVSLGRDVNSRMRYVCALCSRVYTSKYSLERHVRCHTLEKPYSCDVCDFTSSYKEHMMRHITSVHLIVHSNEPKLKYVPKKKREEEEEEDDDDESADGEKKRRNILRKRFECAVCGLKATHKTDLMTHIRDKHPNAHIESMNNNDGSKVHLIVTVPKKVQTPKKLTIQCNYCSLIFHDTWKYKVHLRSHTGVKPFKCSECSFRATSKMTVRDHVHRKHPESLSTAKILLRTVGIDGTVEEVPLSVPWREFKCEYCGEVKEDNYSLKNHKQKEHKDSFPFTCTACDQKEITKASMVLHCTTAHKDTPLSDLILHYGKPTKMAAVKLPSCEICHKVFAYRSQLNLHTRLHTGEKCFNCEHCAYSTNSKTLLLNHMTKKHLSDGTQKADKTKTVIIKKGKKKAKK